MHCFKRFIFSLNKAILLLCLIGFTSCKFVDFIGISSKPLTSKVILGSVGKNNGAVINKRFLGMALPLYGQPIRLSVKKAGFTKHTYKTFLKAKQVQSIEIVFEDSVTTKPEYITLNILDKVGVLEALNAPRNETVKEFLLYQDQSQVITQIDMVFKKEEKSALLNADNVFLLTTKQKQYVLQLYKDGDPLKILRFNKGVVFGYKTSNTCWQEDSKRQLRIIDLVNREGCPKNTYKKADRAKKKIDYFKF